MGWDQSSSTLEYKEYTKLTATTEGGGGGGHSLTGGSGTFYPDTIRILRLPLAPFLLLPPPLPPRLALFCFVLKYAFVIQ